MLGYHLLLSISFQNQPCSNSCESSTTRVLTFREWQQSIKKQCFGIIVFYYWQCPLSQTMLLIINKSTTRLPVPATPAISIAWQKRTHRKYWRYSSTCSMHFPIIFILVSYPILLHKRTKPVTTKSRLAIKKDNRNGFIIMTFLTASTFRLWNPSEAYFTFKGFGLFDSITVVTDVTLVLASLQPVIDPILFMMSLKDFRQCIEQTISRLHRIDHYKHSSDFVFIAMFCWPSWGWGLLTSFNHFLSVCM